MLNLFDKILKDLKKNSKYFIIFVTLFLVVFYGEKKLNQTKKYAYGTHIIFSQPRSSEWVTFNIGNFRQELYHYLITLKTQKKINSLCNLSSSKQTIDLKYTRNDFVFSKITLFHQEMANEMCLEKLFNQIILDHYKKHLSTLMDNNRLLLDFLKEQNKKSFPQNIYLSTLSISFGPPEVIEEKLNFRKISDINHIKIIITSIIFSTILTLTVSNFFPENKKKKRKRS